MFKKGDKFIIEIEEAYNSTVDHTDEAGTIPNKLFRMKGFQALTFDNWGLLKLQRLYPMAGPYGIGCVLRISRPRPENDQQKAEWKKLGWPKTYPEHNPSWMVTQVEKKDDGTWVYHGVQRNGEQIEVPSTTRVTYTGLFFNTVIDWSKYDGDIK